MKKPSVSIYFDKRRMKIGYYSVKWAVYYQDNQKYYSTGVVLETSDVEFLKQNKTGLSGRVKNDYLRNLWNQVYGQTYFDHISNSEKDGILYKGQKALSQIEDYFSFELFSNIVAGNSGTESKKLYSVELIQALEERSKLLRSAGNIGNADIFRSTAFSFKQFAIWSKITSATNAKIPLQIITPQFLREYETWMLVRGKSSQKKDGEPTAASISTVGINCRNLRTIFNEAVAAGVINENYYPFGKGKYRIPKANNKKKALDEGVVLRIWGYICEAGSERSKARDLWMFSYLCNGLNFTDICQIKRSEYDVVRGTIEIYRQKSKNTKREEMTKIQISLLPEAIDIIEEWGSLDKRPDSYLFPFITAEMSPVRKKAAIRQVIKNTNYNMNKIAEALKLDVSINTYEARHTFATTLLRSEAPLAFISQSLGHSSFKTTQSYLGSFQDVQTKKYMSALIPKKLNSTDVENGELNE